MYILAIVSDKGGTGKTTLACSLAVAAQADGLTSVIYDADRFGSAAVWASERKKRTPAVIPTPPKKLYDISDSPIATCAGLGVIDTVPNFRDSAITAACESDFVLIPCRPGLLDMAATDRTVNVAKDLGIPYAVVLNAAGFRSPYVAAARETLKKNGVDVAPVVHQRVAHVHAMASGMTAMELDATSKAAKEIEALWQWLRPKLKHRKRWNGYENKR